MYFNARSEARLVPQARAHSVLTAAVVFPDFFACTDRLEQIDQRCNLGIDLRARGRAQAQTFVRLDMATWNSRSSMPNSSAQGCRLIR